MGNRKTTPPVMERRWQPRVQWIGLVAGPLIAFVLYGVLPDSYRGISGEEISFSPAGRATLAVMAWMAVWWLTEAIDISATALLPIAIFPIFQIADIKAATAPYASSLIFLFLGGFILALSMQRWGLDRRIALLTLRLVGPRPRHMVGGFMLATALMSAFVSNTATVAMMLPIALSVIELVNRRRDETSAGTEALLPGTDARNLALCLLLGVAYAASIGGISTIIGTPPNLFLVSFIRETIAEPYRQEISFLRWMGIGVPFALAFLPMTWLLLTRLFYPVGKTPLEGGRSLVEHQYRKLGPPKAGEWITLVVFGCTALAWMTRPWLQQIELQVGGERWAPLAGLSDPGIAIFAALLLFVIPVVPRQAEFTMNWETAKRLPWGILILFGGGLSLAAAVEANGVAEFLGVQAGLFATWPKILLIMAVITLVIFLTELTSNTATTATLVPILAAFAPGLGLHPFALIVPAAIAASCAFMMPVATPPNAIIFGSGYLTIPQMARAGLGLNLVGILLVTGLMYLIAFPLLSVSFAQQTG